MAREERDLTAEPPKPLDDVEGPFDWALRIAAAGERRLPDADDVHARVAALSKQPGVTTWTPPAAVRAAAGWDDLGLPPYLTVGDGPVRALVIASPHPDEPVGVASALALAEALLRDEFATLRARLRLAIAPLANPRGYRANAAWFAAANALEAREPRREFKMRMMRVAKIRAMAEPRPGNLELADAVEAYTIAYLRHRRRDPPDADIEFGYAPPGADPADPAADFLPECRAHAAFIDELCRRWGGLDVMTPLHSMGMAGGAWALLRTPEASAPRADAAIFMDPYRRAAALTGLGLHDEDRGGAKGFARIAPGFATTPTAAAMRAYFRERGAAVTIRHNSMEWAGARARRVAVPEVPLFLSRGLKDMGASTTRRAEVLMTRADACRQAARALGAGAEVAARRAALENDARALEAEAEAERAAGEAATRQEEARARIEVLARSAAGSAEEAMAAAAATELLYEQDLRPVSLKHQMALQLTLLLAGVRGLG